MLSKGRRGVKNRTFVLTDTKLRFYQLKKLTFFNSGLLSPYLSRGAECLPYQLEFVKNFQENVLIDTRLKFYFKLHCTPKHYVIYSPYLSGGAKGLPYCPKISTMYLLVC